MQPKRARRTYIHEHMKKTVRQIGTACEALFCWVDTSASTENCSQGPAAGPAHHRWKNMVYVQSLLGCPYVGVQIPTYQPSKASLPFCASIIFWRRARMCLHRLFPSLAHTQNFDQICVA